MNICGQMTYISHDHGIKIPAKNNNNKIFINDVPKWININE